MALRTRTISLIYAVLGWLFLIGGVVMLPFPGPGVFAIVLGLFLLSKHYAWAHRLLQPVRRSALNNASKGVQSWFRIMQSVLVILGLVAVGALWVWQPPAPDWWPVAEWIWLFGGVTPGIAMFVTAAFTAGLLVYSWITYRGAPFDPEADKERQRRKSEEMARSAAHSDGEAESSTAPRAASEATP